MQLERLGDVLRQYARDHGGEFPDAQTAVTAIAEERWLVPDPSGLRYIYLPGATLAEGERIVAYEPAIYDGDLLALRANGRVETKPLVTGPPVQEAAP